MYWCVAFKNMAIAGSKSTWFKSSGKILPSFEIFSSISLYGLMFILPLAVDYDNWGCDLH